MPKFIVLVCCAVMLTESSMQAASSEDPCSLTLKSRVDVLPQLPFFDNLVEVLCVPDAHKNWQAMVRHVRKLGHPINIETCIRGLECCINSNDDEILSKVLQWLADHANLTLQDLLELFETVENQEARDILLSRLPKADSVQLETPYLQKIEQQSYSKDEQESLKKLLYAQRDIVEELLLLHLFGMGVYFRGYDLSGGHVLDLHIDLRGAQFKAFNPEQAFDAERLTLVPSTDLLGIGCNIAEAQRWVRQTTRIVPCSEGGQPGIFIGGRVTGSVDVDIRLLRLSSPRVGFDYLAHITWRSDPYENRKIFYGNLQFYKKT